MPDRRTEKLQCLVRSANDGKPLRTEVAAALPKLSRKSRRQLMRRIASGRIKVRVDAPKS